MKFKYLSILLLTLSLISLSAAADLTYDLPHNPGFEYWDLSYWTDLGGDGTVTIVETASHSGDVCLELRGDITYPNQQYPGVTSTIDPDFEFVHFWYKINESSGSSPPYSNITIYINNASDIYAKVYPNHNPDAFHNLPVGDWIEVNVSRADILTDNGLDNDLGPNPLILQVEVDVVGDGEGTLVYGVYFDDFSTIKASNIGFEDGDGDFSGWESYAGASISEDEQHSGLYSAQLDGTGGAFTQKIDTRTNPNITFWAKSASPATLYVIYDMNWTANEYSLTTNWEMYSLNATASGLSFWNNLQFEDQIGGVSLFIDDINFTEDPSPDTTPPQSITDLTYEADCNMIGFSFNYPEDPDFLLVMIWKDGIFYHNLTDYPTYDEWYGLSEGTFYEFSSKTVDTSGNANATFVNMTANTTTCTGPPPPTPTPSSSFQDKINNKLNDVQAMIYGGIMLVVIASLITLVATLVIGSKE
jgi:hypothetical protein